MYIFPSGFPETTAYAFLTNLIRATCLAHPILLDVLILMTRDERTSYEDSRYEFSPPFRFSISGPNISLSTLFSSSLNARSSIMP